jgi:hypothetical protein
MSLNETIYQSSSPARDHETKAPCQSPAQRHEGNKQFFVLNKPIQSKKNGQSYHFALRMSST